MLLVSVSLCVVDCCCSIVVFVALLMFCCSSLFLVVVDGVFCCCCCVDVVVDDFDCCCLLPLLVSQLGFIFVLVFVSFTGIPGTFLVRADLRSRVLFYMIFC